MPLQPIPPVRSCVCTQQFPVVCGYELDGADLDSDKEALESKVLEGSSSAWVRIGMLNTQDREQVVLLVQSIGSQELEKWTSSFSF